MIAAVAKRFSQNICISLPLENGVKYCPVSITKLLQAPGFDLGLGVSCVLVVHLGTIRV